MIKITVEILGIKRDKEINNKGCPAAENCNSALLASVFWCFGVAVLGEIIYMGILIGRYISEAAEKVSRR